MTFRKSEVVQQLVCFFVGGVVVGGCGRVTRMTRRQNNDDEKSSRKRKNTTIIILPCNPPFNFSPTIQYEYVIEKGEKRKKAIDKYYFLYKQTNTQPTPITT
jgi:hypothetical protein